MSRVRFKILFLLLLAISCKKKENDVITYENVKGEVLNLCTDSLMPNISLSLKVIKNNEIEHQKYITTSLADGTFIFNNVEKHSSSNYNYIINIPNNSSYYYDINNASNVLFLNSNNLVDIHTVELITKIFYLTITINHPSITTNSDYIKLTFKQQKLLNKNVEVLKQFTIQKYGGYNVYTEYINFIPSGMWHINIEEFNSGIYSTRQDSIYILPSNPLASYSINW